MKTHRCNCKGVAANALATARGYSDLFSPSGWFVTDVATTPDGLHTDTLVYGDFSTVRGIWPGK